jgi:hypothetical protein
MNVQLEGLQKAADDICALVDRLRAQRAELLAAVERIVACDLSTVRGDYNGRLLDAIAAAHDLLVRLEGKP